MTRFSAKLDFLRNHQWSGSYSNLKPDGEITQKKKKWLGDPNLKELFDVVKDSEERNA